MHPEHRLTRREFLLAGGGLAVHGLTMRPAHASAPTPPALDHYFEELLRDQHVPGLALAIVGPRGVAWSGGYGFADLASGTEMSPVRTVLNVGSVSKTITATAVLQLCEQGRLSLTDDVDAILPFSVRNPFLPETPITTWQLLVHRSSIKDGPEYGRSYGCGPSAHVLGEWLRTYLCPGGERYDADANYHTWAPGQRVVPPEPRSYSNVGFGVLGYLVECVTGTSFPCYCHDHIFVPLGMRDTCWRLVDAPAARHAVPYSFVDEHFQLPEGWSPSDMLPGPGAPTTWPPPMGSQFPHCAYEFVTYPDGGLRTTAEDLGRFLAAFVNGGELGGSRILQEATVRQMLTDQGLEESHGRGLGWASRPKDPDGVLWGHGGADPGIRAAMYFDPQLRIGIAAFNNSSRPAVHEALDHVLDYCLEHRWPPEAWG